MRRIPPIVLAALALTAAAPAPAATTIDLPSAAQLTVTNLPSAAGSDVARAGDVNGDGLEDMLIGAGDGFVDEKRPHPGEVLVVFGRRDRATIDAQRLGGAGLRVIGPEPRRDSYDEEFGGAVAPAGDVNDDGFADLLVGASHANPRSTSNQPPRGGAYIVLGRREPGTLDLSRTPEAAIRVDPPRGALFVGTVVENVGDVSGDGRADLAIAGQARRRADPAVWIVFGAKLPPTIDLASLGSGGVTLTGLDEPPTIAAAGDQDGDGIGDVALGDQSWQGGTGRVTLATRLSGGGARDLRAAPSLTGGRDSELGEGLAGGADVTGDGLPDVVIGAPGQDERRAARGSVRVIPGPWPVQERSAADVPGPVVADDVAHTLLGRSLDLLPDLNGDGRAEILAGSPGTSPGCRLGAGAAWVFEGREAPGAFPPHGDPRSTRLAGVPFGAGAGAIVAHAGDVDGDGRPDLLVDAEPNDDGEADSAPQRTLHVVPAPARAPQEPPPPATTPAPEGDACFSAAVDRASARSLLRTGRLRVRITSYVPLRKAATLLYEITPESRAARRRFVGASFRVEPIRLRSPGSTTATIRINRRTLRRLRRGDRMRIVLFGDTGTTGAPFRVG